VTRNGPTGNRVTAPSDPHGVMNKNFSHIAAAMSDGISQRTPADVTASRNSPSRCLFGKGSNSPKASDGRAPK
jgi:hypothetical protein